MSTNPKPPAVLAGIEAAQKYLSDHGIEKARENTQQGFRFRGIDDVLNVLSTALVHARLAILPSILSFELSERETEKTRGGSSYIQVTYICRLEMEYRIVSLVDGSEQLVTIPSMAFDQSDKAVNKALSGAYKYMAIEAFCIPVEGLPDQDSELINAEAGAPTQVPQLPVQPEKDPLADDIATLENAIRGAASLDDLQVAFKAAVKFARNRKREDLEASFTRLKDTRKELLADATPAEEPQS